MARRGMIATSQPLASAAGLHVLQRGGNAIDAAVTAAAVLAVVEPTMNGIGGDLFALVFDPRDRRIHGLNASGRAGSGAAPETFAARGLDRVPATGILAVSVPGVVDGWAQLLARHGSVGIDRALEPAGRYARDGFPVSEVVAHQWQGAADLLAADPEAARVFLPGGRPPSTGQVFRNPDLAAMLDLIARDGRDAFYHGDIARAILDDSDRRQGLLTPADLERHESDWVDSISTSYRGHVVHELPPNTQGVTALEMLNILERDDIRALGHNSGEYLHLLVEAKRIAWADRDTYLADRRYVPSTVLEHLLSKGYAAARRDEIDTRRAAATHRPGCFPGVSASISDGGTPGNPCDRGDTVYLTAADGDGFVVSLIQSLFSNFGAGIVVAGTGIALQNRGSLFTLDATHPNQIAPRKRPLHTLIPAMVLKSERPWLSYGVMGGDMQPQGHVQVLVNLLDFGMNLQEAGEAARLRHMADGVALESAIPNDARQALERRGHRLVNSPGSFGGFQGILIDTAAGVLMGASDPRKDGLAIGW